MKKTILITLLSILYFISYANTFAPSQIHSDNSSIVSTDSCNNVVSSKNVFGFFLQSSNFNVGLDIQTKYVWRGMEMMTEDATPVLFPSIGYSYKGIYAYAMGGYATNGKYAEVDLGISYTYKWLTIGINDYYYPTTNTAEDHYFTFTSKNTGHWWEGVIAIAPEKIPAKLTLSNFFAGADKTLEGKQAYSTYAEISTWYDFLESNQIALNVGAAFNKSCYNGYEHNFGVCNIELKYTHSVVFKNGWTMPLGVAYIVNPIHEKCFVNFTTNIAF